MKRRLLHGESWLKFNQNNKNFLNILILKNTNDNRLLQLFMVWDKFYESGFDVCYFAVDEVQHSKI